MYVFHVQKFLVESWHAATVLNGFKIQSSKFLVESRHGATVLSIFPGSKALWLLACEPASLLFFLLLRKPIFIQHAILFQERLYSLLVQGDTRHSHCVRTNLVRRVLVVERIGVNTEIAVNEVYAFVPHVVLLF